MVKKVKKSSLYGENMIAQLNIENLNSPNLLEIYKTKPAVNKINKIHDAGNIISSVGDYFEKAEFSFLQKYDVPIDLMHENQKRGMYAFITEELCLKMAEWINGRKVLDPLAGRGWLAHGLRTHGVDVYATDNNSWNLVDDKKLKITEIEKLDALEAIEKYASEIGVMIISWSPLDDKIDYKMIKKLHKLNPNAEVVYIGEFGGATSSEKFFNNIEVLKDKDFQDVKEAYHTVRGLNDTIDLVKFKPKKKTKGGGTNEKR